MKLNHKQVVWNKTSVGSWNATKMNKTSLKSKYELPLNVSFGVSVSKQIGRRKN